MNRLVAADVRLVAADVRRLKLFERSGSSLAVLLLLLGTVLGARADGSAASDTVLEFEPVWNHAPLAIDRSEGAMADGSSITVSRLDLLLSGIALREENGTWLESRDWTAFLSAGRKKLSARLEGIPPRRFTSVRFSVGLPPEVNSSDPNQYPPGHPLHPQENGLHWGWQGGYIFLALEGRAHRMEGETLGFSYHLGNIENRVGIEIPGVIDGRRDRTVRVQFDVARLFRADSGVNPWRDGTSTHSRPGDPIAAKLQAGLRAAFSHAGASSDQFQVLEHNGPPNSNANATAKTKALANANANVPGAAVPGTPWPWQISARLPKVALPADNLPTVEGVALGQRLFNEARLSRGNAISCAGCHQRESAFADGGKRFSLGVEGRTGVRNAMPLFNLAWQREFFWDGRVTGLRHQVLAPIQDAHEMAESLDRVVAKLSQDAEYPELFRRLFGDRQVTAARVGLAVEQYLLTLVSQNSKFDRAARGEVELSGIERQGLRLFVTENDPARGLQGADCFHCHGGNLFTSGAYANNGLDRVPADPGRFAVSGQEADRGKFRVPSLRNVAVSGPYMHDGRFATLEDVIEHYNGGVQPSPTLDPNLAKHPQLGLRLSAADKQALAAFLRTLTDDDFLKPLSQTQTLTQR